MNISSSLRALLSALSCASALLLVGQANAATYSPGGFTLTTGQQVTAGTMTLTLTTGGELQVTDANGTISWRSGTSGVCSGSSCYAKFQLDNNFILTTPSGTTSLSHTDGRYGNQLVFSATPPYLSVAPSTGAPLWTSGQSYAPGGFTLVAGQEISVNGVYLGLTTAGAVEVRKVGGSQQLLWTSGTFSECATPSSCSLTFANGALKLNSPSGEVWTTATTISAGGTLRLSNFDPYLSITTADGAKRPVVWGTGSGNSVTYPSDRLKVGPNVKVLVGNGYRLTVNSAGNIQIAQGANPAAWSTGATGSCSASCYLYFQADGNLVLYGSPLWSTNTGGNNGGYLNFSPTAPYAAVLNQNFDPRWTSTSIPTPIVRPVSTAVRGNQPKAETVQSFLDSLGINTHQDQYEGGNSANPAVAAQGVLTKLQYIGVKRIRDHAPTTSQLPWFNTLSASGIKFNLVSYDSNPSSFITRAKSVGVANLESIEGLNEINNFGFSFNGFLCEAGGVNICGGAARDAQQKLYDAVQADSSLNSVSVFDLTGGLSAMHAPVHGLTTLSGRADMANVHPYSLTPTIQQPKAKMAAAVGVEYNALASTAVVTEAGYPSASVGTTAQAVMNLNTWLNGYSLGYARTYIYYLTDGWGETYGFYDTSNSPKLAAHAAHNLTTLLNDAGAPLANTGSLNWSASTAFTGGSILLQKSNGVFYLIVWNEPPASQVINNSYGTTNIQLTVQRSQINVYDPVAQASAIQQYPLPVSGSTSVSLQVGANPLVLEIAVP